MKSKEFSQFISTFLNIRRYFIAVSPNSKRFRGCVSLKKKKKKSNRTLGNYVQAVLPSNGEWSEKYMIRLTLSIGINYRITAYLTISLIPKYLETWFHDVFNKDQNVTPLLPKILSLYVGTFKHTQIRMLVSNDIIVHTNNIFTLL